METLRNNLATIVVGACIAMALIVACVLLGPWRAGTTTHGTAVAVVHDGDGSTHELPLEADATLEVRTSLGTNTVVVEEGQVRISEADCPKQSCLHQAPISRPGEQLICLPHQLWVEIVDEEAGSAGDTQLDRDAVTWQDDDTDVDLVSR